MSEQNKGTEIVLYKAAAKPALRRVMTKCAEGESFGTRVGNWLSDPENLKDLGVGAALGLGTHLVTGMIPGLRKQKGLRFLLGLGAMAGGTKWGGDIRNFVSDKWNQWRGNTGYSGPPQLTPEQAAANNLENEWMQQGQELDAYWEPKQVEQRRALARQRAKALGQSAGDVYNQGQSQMDAVTPTINTETVDNGIIRGQEPQASTQVQDDRATVGDEMAERLGDDYASLNNAANGMRTQQQPATQEGPTNIDPSVLNYVADNVFADSNYPGGPMARAYQLAQAYQNVQAQQQATMADQRRAQTAAHLAAQDKELQADREAYNNATADGRVMTGSQYKDWLVQQPDSVLSPADIAARDREIAARQAAAATIARDQQNAEIRRLQRELYPEETAEPSELQATIGALPSALAGIGRDAFTAAKGVGSDVLTAAKGIGSGINEARQELVNKISPTTPSASDQAAVNEKFNRAEKELRLQQLLKQRAAEKPQIPADSPYNPQNIANQANNGGILGQALANAEAQRAATAPAIEDTANNIEQLEAAPEATAEQPEATSLGTPTIGGTIPLTGVEIPPGLRGLPPEVINSILAGQYVQGTPLAAAIRGAAKDLGSEVKSVGSDLRNRAGLAAKDIGAGAKNLATKAINEGREISRDLGTRATNAAKDIGTGIANQLTEQNGIADLNSEVENQALQNVGSQLGQGAKRTWEAFTKSLTPLFLSKADRERSERLDRELAETNAAYAEARSPEGRARAAAEAAAKAEREKVERAKAFLRKADPKNLTPKQQEDQRRLLRQDELDSLYTRLAALQQQQDQAQRTLNAIRRGQNPPPPPVSVASQMPAAVKEQLQQAASTVGNYMTEQNRLAEAQETARQQGEQALAEDVARVLTAKTPPLTEYSYRPDIDLTKQYYTLKGAPIQPGGFDFSRITTPLDRVLQIAANAGTRGLNTLSDKLEKVYHDPETDKNVARMENTTQAMQQFKMTQQEIADIMARIAELKGAK